MIPAAGVGGKPFSGQEESAEMKASCSASSAQSKEPERRMSVAMILPDSSRKTCSMVSPGSGTERESPQPRRRRKEKICPAASIWLGRNVVGVKAKGNVAGGKNDKGMEEFE